MSVELWLFTGLLAAVLDYTFAVGFGLIASIVLVVIADADPRTIAGTAALTQVILVVLATGLHIKAGNISAYAKRKAYLLPAFISASILGGLLAALLAVNLSERSIDVIYPLSLIFLSIVMLYDSWKQSEVDSSYSNFKFKELGLAVLTGIISGIYKALVGGGFSSFIFLAQRKLGVDIKSSIALTPLLKFPSFFIIGLVYYLNNYIIFKYLIALTAGALVGLIISINLLSKLSSNLILKMMAIFILIIAFIRLTYLF